MPATAKASLSNPLSLLVPAIGLNRNDSSRFSFARAIELCVFLSGMFIEMCVFPGVEPAGKCEGVVMTSLSSIAPRGARG